MTLLFGNHTLKGGFDCNRDLILNWFPGIFSGQYTFNSVAIVQPRPARSRYVQNFRGRRHDRSLHESRPLRDRRLRPGRVPAGRESHLQPRRCGTTSRASRSPRSGTPTRSFSRPASTRASCRRTRTTSPSASVSPGRRRATTRTVVRGGYGMFYGRTPSIMIGTAMSNNGINVQTLTFTGAQMPVYPNIFPSLPTGAAAAEADDPRVRPELREPARPPGEPRHRARGVERPLGRPLVSLREGHEPPALGGHQRRLAFRRQRSRTPRGTSIPSRGTARTARSRTSTASSSSRARPSPTTTASRSSSTSASRTTGRRASRTRTARCSTRSRTRPRSYPDVGDDGKQASDPRNFQADYAVGDADQRHRLVLSAYWSLPYGRNAGGWSRPSSGAGRSRDSSRSRAGSRIPPILAPTRRHQQRRQRPERPRAGIRAQLVQLPDVLLGRPAHHEGHSDRPGDAPAHRGGFQRLQPLERERRESGLLRRERHESREALRIRHADDLGGPAHRPARGEGHLLMSPSIMPAH